MPSEKQIRANRENAKRAGVKSDEGKAIVRFNAVKHGLTASSCISGLRSFEESLADLNQILQLYREEFQPRNPFEDSLVQKMAVAEFKLGRYECLESGAFEDHGMIGSDFLSASEDRLSLALKYKQSIDAQFYRAYSTLSALRQAHQLDLFLPDGTI